ncbi:hypothetical protein [Cellvibrio polysaccharolyticus]|uniref:Uncharacterized protein n=1 Tax=Cellvibrio polysaccharolyticus TaxID=2082724 RepID=A0A928V2T9_9GAMM|nr:hypothetical protein [Cellvibrio polysaccharolyticus]MBE8716150.1 hypothetical protein [Cellvibrio polysaccharolyticus]
MAGWVRFLEIFLLLILTVSLTGFLSFVNLYGFFLALVTAAIIYGVYRRQRWGYFSAAAWGLACYQLAKQGYEFAEVKRQVMVSGILVIIIAIILHEKIARKSPEHPNSNSDNP